MAKVNETISQHEGKQNLGRGTSAFAGTTAYMAPEQWDQSVVDCRADLYSLGCILFEMLTGSTLYKGKTLDDLKMQHLTAPISRVDDSLAPDFINHILQKCLAKDPTQRLSEPTQLLEALEGYYQETFGEPPKQNKQRPRMENEGYYHLRGLTHYQLQDYAQALYYYSKGIESNSENQRLHINRGNTYVAMADYPSSICDYTRAIELGPNSADVASAYSGRGLANQCLGRMEQALEDFSAAVKLAPLNYMFLLNRAQAYVSVKDYDNTLIDINRALELEPDCSNIYFVRGLAYDKRNEKEKAISDYEQAIVLDNTFEEAYHALAELYFDMRDFRSALINYSKALEFWVPERRAQLVYSLSKGDFQGNDEGLLNFVKPSFTNASFFIKKGYSEMCLGAYPEAIDDFTKSLELQPNVCDPWYYRGKAHLYAGNLREALQDLNKAAELDSHTSEIYNDRGQVHRALGNHELALRDLTTAVQLDPGDPRARYNRSWVMMDAKDWKNALADVNGAIELSPNSAQPYTLRGLIELGMGQKSLALSDLKRAVELDPSLPEPYFNIGSIYRATGEIRQALWFLNEAAKRGFSPAIDMIQSIIERH